MNWVPSDLNTAVQLGMHVLKTWRGKGALVHLKFHEELRYIHLIAEQCASAKSEQSGRDMCFVTVWHNACRFSMKLKVSVRLRGPKTRRIDFSQRIMSTA